MNWKILSYTSGLGERIRGVQYFEYSNLNDAMAILISACLGMKYTERISYLQNNTSFYFSFFNDPTRCYVINDLPERFSELVLPLLRFFSLYITEDSALPMYGLNEKSGEATTHLIDAYKNKQKGIKNLKKFHDNIYHVSCWWPLDMQKQTCSICGCNQPGFMLTGLFYCFDCIIEYSKLENVREVWENKITDAEGNVIKMFTRYVTPNREIVFFDRDGTRLIYLKSGKVELPLNSEKLYPLIHKNYEQK